MNRQLHLLPLILALFPGLGAAQAPQRDIYANPQNLQVLPKDISAAELGATMKSFALGLGVRCETCHVGEAGQPLTSFDFESDDKAMKEKARVMIKMVRKINNNYVERLNAIEKDSRVAVRCVTCHRGQARPELIEDVLDEALAEGGVAGAVTRYTELRQTYYGSHTFDFSEFSLAMYSQRLAGQGNLDAALALLDINCKYFPESYYTLFLLGEINSMAGNEAEALDSFARAVELNPNASGFLQPKMEKLKEQL